MLTTAGMYELVDIWSNEDSPVPFLYIAYGTGTTAENVAHTALVTEVDRELAELSIQTTYEPSDTRRFRYLFIDSHRDHSCL